MIESSPPNTGPAEDPLDTPYCLEEDVGPCGNTRLEDLEGVPPPPRLHRKGTLLHHAFVWIDTSLTAVPPYAQGRKQATALVLTENMICRETKSARNLQ